ncbi:DUF5808 domain-containing protein [Tautonia rosea]|uniref:DUF5808 domain-containing protein n=1 Tax=Tautonia rosea TaxID=2728037 RepID=UPI0019D11299|nr:DUF5808 domain-containing protein [Tautonia rosea]
MNQAEINDAEWHDPRNWHGKWFEIYRSPRDSRAWVPKRSPWMGVTVNFAHASGPLTVLLLLAVALGVTIVALIASN